MTPAFRDARALVVVVDLLLLLGVLGPDGLESVDSFPVLHGLRQFRRRFLVDFRERFLDDAAGFLYGLYNSGIENVARQCWF